MLIPRCSVILQVRFKRSRYIHRQLQKISNNCFLFFVLFRFCFLNLTTLFTGIKNGTIVEPRGSFDYAWDPIFQPLNHDLTYGEMEKSFKNSISHYRHAVEQIKSFLLKEHE